MESIIKNQNEAQVDSHTEPHYVKPYYEVDTHERKGYTMRVFTPGISKEGLNLSLEEGILKLEGRRTSKIPKSWLVVHRELPEHDYRLQLELNADIDKDKINAQLKDGIIYLSLPLSEAVKTRTIKVD